MFTAVLTAIALGAAAYFLIARLYRRQAEARSGIEAIAEMRWRDFAHLALETLRRLGFVETPFQRRPGDSHFDFILIRNDERWLLTCKHGTGYRLGEQTVRDFATAVRMQSAKGGIVVTLGRPEGFAKEIARVHGIRILDARAFWALAADLVDTDLADAASERARRDSNRLLAAAAMVILAVSGAVYALAAEARREIRVPDLGAHLAEIRPDRRLPEAGAQPTPSRPEQRSADAPIMESETERTLVVERLLALDAMLDAHWPTRTTLAMRLDRPLEQAHPNPIEIACALLAGSETLRYTRLQIEPPPGSEGIVQWRVCPENH